MDGRIVIRDTELVVADEQQLMAEAETAASELHRRAGITSRLTR